MKASIIHPRELDAGLIKAWRHFQTHTPSLQSPFYAPEFTVAVGNAREDARVAILEEDGRVRGFLPFHMLSAGVAKPIGGQICDYQGVVHSRDFTFTGIELLKACGLSAYDFNHAPMDQTALLAGASHFSSSPQMDISEGYEAYSRTRPKSFRDAMREVRRRTRKVESEFGPLQFVYDEPNSSTYAAHVRMRNDLYRRANVKSLLGAASWVDEVIAELRSIRASDFAGVFSALYAGERLIAAHFGLRSSQIWHWWFNSYDTDLYKLGPGILLIHHAAVNANGNGLHVVDFGRGEAHYKLTFANTEVALCEGSIEKIVSAPGFARRLQRSGARSLKWLPLGKHRDLIRRASSRILTGGIRLA